MRRIALIILIAACLSGVATVHALVPDNVNASSSKVVTPGINNVAEDQAEMLKSLGLFIGTDNGFELHRHLNRAEAAALIVRFMGEEKNALAQKNKHPFKDVPSWADSYVGWLYKNKITYGVDAKHYGGSQNISYWQFATMLSRISTGSDDFISAGVGVESERSFIDRDNQDPPGSDFFRSDAVSMLTRFIRCAYLKDLNESLTMAQFLIGKGVFTADQFVEAGIRIYPISYGRTEEGKMRAALAGVPFRESKLSGISGDTADPVAETQHFYAWKYEGDLTILYRMDCLSLEENEAVRWPQADMPRPWRIYYLTSLGGRDFLAIWYEDGVSLVTSDGTNTEKVAAGKDFGIDSKQYGKPYLIDGDKLVVTVDDTVYIFSEDGDTRHKLAAGVTFIGTQNSLAVLYSEKSGFGVIEGMRLTDWSVTDIYRVPLPDEETAKYWPPEWHPLIRQHYGEPYDKEAGIYGEAGLFVVREGRLERVTARPVLGLAYLRIGPAGAYAVLTHDSGTPPIGSAIYQYNGPMLTGKDGYEEIERLSSDPPHGIKINSIHGADSMVFFESRTAVGMESFDVFTYYPFYNSEEDHMGIVVMSFTAGQPEMSFFEHDAQWYVQKEQERLNELGYKPYCIESN